MANLSFCISVLVSGILESGMVMTVYYKSQLESLHLKLIFTLQQSVSIAHRRVYTPPVAACDKRIFFMTFVIVLTYFSLNVIFEQRKVWIPKLLHLCHVHVWWRRGAKIFLLICLCHLPFIVSLCINNWFNISPMLIRWFILVRATVFSLFGFLF